MELKNVSYNTRWVYAFADDPEAGVEMRRLNDGETNRIYDYHRYVPGSPKSTMVKLTKVIEDVVDQSIVSWKGFTEGGSDLECSRENKLRLLDMMVTNEDGDRRSAWVVLNDKFALLEEADRKNSPSSPAGGTS